LLTLPTHRLLHFVARLRRPVVSGITADDLNAFKKADETVFLAFIDPADVEAQNAFADVAKGYYKDFTFGLAASGVNAPAGTTAPAVVCYKPVDGESVSFTSFEKPGELDGWAKEASRPVIGELTPANHQRFLDVCYAYRPCSMDARRY
jgi:protein disulfide-isomerase A1